MKILTLNSNLKGVGTYRRCFYFSRELARHGHDVTMVTVARDAKYSPKTYYKKDWLKQASAPQGEGPWVRLIEGPGLGYKWLPGWGSGPLDIGLRLREILAKSYDAIYGFEYQPDVAWPVYLTRHFKSFHFYSDWCDWYAGHSNQMRGIKLAQQIDGFFEERIRLQAEKVSVTSKVLHQRALAIGVPPDRVVQIPEGSAVDYIQPVSRTQVRTQFGIPLDAPVLVTVREGNMHREVQIFDQVLKQLPTALFVMIGRPSETAIQLATTLGIQNQIIATGWVSDEDYPLYLGCADVCFCPLEDNLNNRARWPAKILDFLAAGRATVTNGVGEVLDLFTQHEVGVLTEQGHETFAADIVKLLNDKERIAHLEQQARRIMVEEWDYRVRGSKIIRLFDTN